MLLARDAPPPAVATVAAAPFAPFHTSIAAVIATMSPVSAVIQLNTVDPPTCRVPASFEDTVIHRPFRVTHSCAAALSHACLLFGLADVLL